MKNISLQKKLTALLFIALLVIASVLTQLAGSRLSDQQQTAIQSRVAGIADASIQGIKRWMDIQQSIVDTVIRYSAPEQRERSLKQAELSGKFELVYIGTPTGEMIRSTPNNRVGYDPRVRPWYQAAENSNNIELSAAYVDALTKELVITISKSFRKNGQLAGVVGGDVSIASLISDINALEVGRNGQAILLEKDGRIIAYPESDKILKPSTDIASNLTLPRINEMVRQGQVEPVTINGVEKLVYFEEIQDVNWILGVILDEHTETEASNELVTSFIITSTILTLLVVALAALAVKHLMGDLMRVSQALAEIAGGGGDLTKRIEPQSNDEVGKLAVNFNLFVDSLHSIIVKLRDIADELKTQSNTSANVAKQNSDAVARQLDEINLVATAVTEMSSATHEIAGNADNTAQNAEEAIKISQGGVDQVVKSQQSINHLADEVNRARQVIENLNDHAQSINSIIAAIQGIAEQTNLLALNAAIEAARAGEQGRGFAVVADEVRVLSQRTHDSTQEIQGTIETLQRTTQEAMNLMLQSGQLAETSVQDAEFASQSLERINASVQNISDMATQIASAAEEQSSVTNELNSNTEAIRSVSDELVGEALQSANAAQRLNELSQQLENEVKRFVL
ncbi:methyl-accepting chemotaxis protein [Photobacterium sp. MCCC 1A19761]|uniref:methyl-accepting chemotaxis protein n=1 Tax=Photobacterium sp. MCCC 1A19761 TaxID=3115000 RepID=UPI00307D337A